MGVKEKGWRCGKTEEWEKEGEIEERGLLRERLTEVRVTEQVVLMSVRNKSFNLLCTLILVCPVRIRSGSFDEPHKSIRLSDSCQLHPDENDIFSICAAMKAKGNTGLQDRLKKTQKRKTNVWHCTLLKKSTLYRMCWRSYVPFFHISNHNTSFNLK